MSPRIIIIGSGFGGIAAAIELKKAGHDDIVILEKADDVGGVWRDNTYPGAACDVPTPLYSYSFEPNPDWPRRYAPQPAILAYLRGVTEKYDVRRHVRCRAEVAAATWDDRTGTWQVELTSGEVLSAEVLIPATGQLSRPLIPRIEGRDSFTGAAFHSARWDHGTDLAGKRVAVIGTGASAIQLVPTIQPTVTHMTVFQRSAPYVVPRWDAAYGPLHHRLFRRVPLSQRAERLGWWVYFEVVTAGYVSAPLIGRAITALSRRHMRRQTASRPGLFERVWPDFPFGCKRGMISDTYLPALTQPNVDLVTEPIGAIEPDGVRTTDGTLHEVDVIIYGTGFAATEFLAPITVTGCHGLSLATTWEDGAHARLGMTISGFPNFLLMYGPNTNTGGGSIVFFLETQARYIRRYVDHVASTGMALDLRPEVEAAFDAEIQGRLADSVWTQCSSWYRHASGRITNNWPGVSAEYRRRAVFTPADYGVVHAAGDADVGTSGSRW